MKMIAITGASGFIGKHLVAQLLREGGYAVRVLSRNRQRDLGEGRFGKEVEVFEGDINDPHTLGGFLVPGCTVINLVYLWDAGEERNRACTSNLLDACKEAGVSRLIHCSTAAVAGRVADDLVDEKTRSQPVTDYGLTKLKIEQDIIDASKGAFEAIVLRPTAVFGISGEPLKKLAADLGRGNRWKNYLKSCLFGRRRMNLVHVANVVAAFVFLISNTRRLEGEIFIVSDDDDPRNNFVDVEEFLMDALGVKKYSLPRLPLPLTLLKWLLLSLGRNNVNPRCDFDPGRLRRLGFNSPVSLCEGLAEYAAWYRAAQLGEKGRKPS